MGCREEHTRGEALAYISFFTVQSFNCSPLKPGEAGRPRGRRAVIPLRARLEELGACCCSALGQASPAARRSPSRRDPEAVLEKPLPVPVFLLGWGMEVRGWQSQPRAAVHPCRSPARETPDEVAFSGPVVPPCQPSNALGPEREIKALSSASAGLQTNRAMCPPGQAPWTPPNGDACVGAAVPAILVHEWTSRALTAVGTHTNAPLCPLSHLPLLLLGPDARRTMALSMPRFTAGKGGGEARTRVESRKEKGLRRVRRDNGSGREGTRGDGEI